MEKNNDDEHANKDATVDTNISDFKKKINLEEEKYEVSKDKDVFKAPKDFQVPATTKNKKEIDETTILK